MPECNRKYWDKIKEGALYLQQCSRCHRFVFYPRSLCPYCWGSDLEWKPVSGKGRLYSYTVVNVSALPEFADETPYIYTVIELDEGVKMPGTIVECSINEARVDMPVEVCFTERQGRKLPVFKRRDV